MRQAGGPKSSRRVRISQSSSFSQFALKRLQGLDELRVFLSCLHCDLPKLHALLGARNEASFDFANPPHGNVLFTKCKTQAFDSQTRIPVDSNCPCSHVGHLERFRSYQRVTISTWCNTTHKHCLVASPLSLHVSPSNEPVRQDRSSHDLMRNRACVVSP